MFNVNNVQIYFNEFQKSDDHSRNSEKIASSPQEMPVFFSFSVPLILWQGIFFTGALQRNKNKV